MWIAYILSPPVVFADLKLRVNDFILFFVRIVCSFFLWFFFSRPGFSSEFIISIRFVPPTLCLLVYTTKVFAFSFNYFILLIYWSLGCLCRCLQFSQPFTYTKCLFSFSASFQKCFALFMLLLLLLLTLYRV